MGIAMHIRMRVAHTGWHLLATFRVWCCYPLVLFGFCQASLVPGAWDDGQ